MTTWHDHAALTFIMEVIGRTGIIIEWVLQVGLGVRSSGFAEAVVGRRLGGGRGGEQRGSTRMRRRQVAWSLLACSLRPVLWCFSFRSSSSLAPRCALFAVGVHWVWALVVLVLACACAPRRGERQYKVLCSLPLPFFFKQSGTNLPPPSGALGEDCPKGAKDRLRRYNRKGAQRAERICINTPSGAI